MSQKEKAIKIILEDLYKADPSLKEHEQELVEIISQLIQAKPTAELDDEFRRQLREQILKMAQEIKLNTKFGKSRFTWADSFMQSFLKPAGLVVAGVLLAVIIGVPFVLQRGQGVEKIESPFAFKVSKTADEAFGSLVTEQAAPEGDALGRGGGGPVSVSKGMAVEEAAAGEEPVAMPMPAPSMQRVNYTFVYKGEGFTIDEGKMPVFQKQKDSRTASVIGSYLRSIDVGALDLSKFKNAKLEYFNITEDRPNGYTISVNFSEGTVSINKNWRQWERETEEALKMSDLPSDEAIIAVANQFVKDYGINLSSYGTAEVRKDWMSGFGEPEMSGASYVPSSITVLYPLLVEGIGVYERSGFPTGLQVSIDIREMKVAGLWNLSSQQYQSSLYETETDTEKILEAAHSAQRNYSFENPTQTLEFELGTPRQVLAKVYSYEEAEVKEFLVPALLFPVTKAPEGVEYYQEDIVVPLVKEILEKESARALLVPRAVPAAPEPALQK